MLNAGAAGDLHPGPAPRECPLPGSAPTLPELRGRHAGAAVLVVGCGRSACAPPAGVLTIGVNDIGRLFDPTYLVVLNPPAQFRGDRFDYVRRSGAQALFSQLPAAQLGPVAPPLVALRLGPRGGTDIGDGGELPCSRDSPYVAVCLAAYLGASRIGLLGVDFTDDHFFGATGRHALAPWLPEIDARYRALGEALAARRVELVNLSPLSRLTGLARGSLASWLGRGWAARSGPSSGTGGATVAAATALAGSSRPRAAAEAAAAPAAAVDECTGSATRCATPVPQTPLAWRCVAVAAHGPGPIGDFLDAVATSAAALGHEVVRDPRRWLADPAVLHVVWNGRQHRSRGPVLYCEHGWLPRSGYQVSAAGINAGSHLAPFRWDGQALPPDAQRALALRLEALRAEALAAAVPACTAVAPAGGFLLVPLQVESDTNIVRWAPEGLRSMQALVDAVSASGPPWPVVFKQHPADARRGNAQLHLRLRRRQDAIWAHAQADVHTLLRHPGCRGVVTINSNVAHDALLWDLPVAVLGRNVWPQQGSVLPFDVGLPPDWQTFADRVALARRASCRQAYARFLVESQWSLADARDPRRVARWLDLAGVPEVSRAAGLRVSGAELPGVGPEGLGCASTRDVGSAAGGRAARRAPARPKPVVNVVARNRGWVFEELKALLARQDPDDLVLVASDEPVADAAAWIVLRAREIASVPDPSRALVHIHDELDGDLYRPGGLRAGVARCGALLLSQPGQRAILERNGIDLSSRPVAVQPVGWRDGLAVRAALQPRPTLGWIGRPEWHLGQEVRRLDRFVDAVLSLGGQADVVLLGQGLEDAARRLLRAGVPHQCITWRVVMPGQARERVATLDALVDVAALEVGPPPWFDAMASGVPVVTTRCGCAADWIVQGQTGWIVEDPDQLAATLLRVLSNRAGWFARRNDLRAHVAAVSRAAWASVNIELVRMLIQKEKGRTISRAALFAG
jgi:glycosyltransferase involved in cell wall biosynthesis